MAGDWIKVETVTPDKPEVFQIAEALNIDPDAVTGKLIRIWIWADQQTTDGNARGVTKLLLDRIAGVSGFADAMQKVGWLTNADGGLTFVNFTRHNGQTAKKRALTNKRVARYRNATCNADSVTKAFPEKRVEKSNNPTAGSPASNTARQSKRKATEYPPEFETAWAAYPKRAGDNPKRRAFRAWSARAKEGHTADEMLAGVNRYAEFCRATGKVGTETVKQAATFLGPDLAFLEDWATPAQPRPGNGGHPRSDDEWVATGERLGIYPRRGETMHDLKVRVRAALDGTRQGVSA
ncbi:hypothetical protein TK90_1231 [Thioalkalivibrio sp. K90mix]|uniref:hypothetical protein n=1 Tax=Thioalkalivibrio sp. (strain K90mix) TaxID=396595 RepID=UPI000195A3DE|nr:hypothetical protein [Thioalkalivibrio sp. K90mix]ADC71740.1 hypothetical protein TK90_1231 [Thioalkalivibrio sp. K90mix]